MPCKLSYKLILPALLLFVCGCGKYGQPLPPEVFSPRAVKSLQASGETEGVRFQWVAPDLDVRGKELESMDGYEITRKVFEGEEDFIAKKRDFELVGSVPDTHVEELRTMREEYRARGIPSHRASVDKEKKEFEFLDTAVTPGVTYLYRIVPVNQGGVEGEVGQFVKVIFKGDASEVTLIERKDDELL